MHLRGERGASLIELLVSTGIMLTITGAIFALMNPAQGSAQAQPEVADMQQRMRVGQETLFRELVMAGAGPYQGAASGSLVNFFAPVLPRRTGRLNPDPSQGAGSYKADAITLAYVPNTYAQTTISNAMPVNSSELKVNDIPGCPQGQNLCGFEVGMNVLVFDAAGNFDTLVITNVQHNAGHIQHKGTANHRYDTGSQLMQIVSYTYYLNRTTNQLMRYDGDAGEVAIVDNVVDLQLTYYGDPEPPIAPKPPAGVANCLYDSAGNFAGLPTLTAADGSLAVLPSTLLTDGPYCGSGANQFDADLLRIRKVRVMLRLQAALPALRGTDPALFLKPGSAAGGERYVPDYRVTFDVTPRNLNLAR